MPSSPTEYPPESKSCGKGGLSNSSLLFAAIDPLLPFVSLKILSVRDIIRVPGSAQVVPWPDAVDLARTGSMMNPNW